MDFFQVHGSPKTDDEVTLRCGADSSAKQLYCFPVLLFELSGGGSKRRKREGERGEAMLVSEAMLMSASESLNVKRVVKNVVEMSLTLI